MKINALKHLKNTAELSRDIQSSFVEINKYEIIAAARLLAKTFKSGNKVLIMGNGGSAADAQHMAAELVGKMLRVDRRPLPAIALTTDTSALTAIANDYGYDYVFSRQIGALANKNDVIIAISTSGNSQNIIQGIFEANKIGCKVISLTGGNGGWLMHRADIALNVPHGFNSCRIQESHIFAIHSIVDLLDSFYLK